ncbi:MAG: hypothetical protein OER97_11530 [Gammaproteobacteria bacterium]|nr:hypothetical protein [Gammaproteobacteria bacterium]
MLRGVLGAIVGIAVAVLTVILFEWISHTIFPVPPELDTQDSAEMSAYMASAPLGALLLVLAGYLVATFDGTFVACWIGRAKPHVYALLIGVLMLVATVSTLIMIPHPLWFSAAAFIGIIIAAWAAFRVAPSAVQSRDRSE